MIKIAIVSPCYNEEDVLDISAKKLTELFDHLIEKSIITKDSFVLYVNDGSKDRTWDIIKDLNKHNRYIYGLSLAGNVGHQNAIMAGMMKVKDICDACITIDADLQDDLSAIEKMIAEKEKGIDVVYGVKISRSGDSVPKRISAQLFYKIQKAMGVKAVYNHADFRLMSKKALGYLSNYSERNLYLRGIIPQMGLKSSTVDDYINPRLAGNSKYTLKKMLNLAFDGITSFSTVPLSIIIGLGIISLFISFIMVIHIFYSWAKGSNVPGWTEMMTSLWFIGSVIMISIGVVGLYVGKIYVESKSRPLWLEDEFICQD